jgi:hypothetical protein
MPMSLGSSLMLGATNAIPFQPQSLGSALVAWWDPDYGITKDSVSNRVSSWKDRVTDMTLGQSTGSRQPLYVADAAEMNSRPSLSFDAQPQFIFINPSPAAIRVQQQENTYLAVVRGANDVVSTGGLTAGNMLLSLFSSKVRAHVWFAGGLRTQDGLTTINSTTRGMVGQMTDSTRVYPILNGAKDNVGVLTTTAATPTSVFSVGWRGTSSGESFLGRIGDVLVFNRALTDAELSKIYLWAKARWAL